MDVVVGLMCQYKIKVELHRNVKTYSVRHTENVQSNER